MTGFQRNVEDVIFYSYDPVTFISKYINLNKQSDNGLEIELNARPNASVTFRTFYAFVDGQVTDKSGPKDSTYNNLFRRPKHSLGVNVSYKVTPKLFISANLKTIGNRSDLYFNLSTFDTENVVLEPYTLIDLYVEYTIWKDNLKVWLDAKNLLNQNYAEVYGYNTQQVNFMAGLNIRL